MDDESTRQNTPHERRKGKSATERIDRIADRIARSLGDSLPLAFEKIGYTEEIAGLVHLLAARSNDAKDEVLRKALTLYGLALDQREKGNRLAFLSPDDDIVHEVVGFEPVIQTQ